MTVAGTTGTLPRPGELLARAVDYLQGSLSLASTEALPCKTPCAGWDLGALLAHVDDSLSALGEIGAIGRTSMVRPTPYLVEVGGVVDRLIWRASQAAAAWVDDGPALDPALVADRSLPAHVIAAVGSLEVAVHGWDVAIACGQHRPIPAPLAEDLLSQVHYLVTPEDRPVRFAPAIPVNPWMPAGDRLLAHLGRCPMQAA